MNNQILKKIKKSRLYSIENVNDQLYDIFYKIQKLLYILTQIFIVIYRVFDKKTKHGMYILCMCIQQINYTRKNV